GVAATLAVDRIRPRRERHVPAGSAATFPNAEPDQLQASNRPIGEMELGVGQLAGRVALVVGGDLDREHRSLSARPQTCGLAAGLPHRIVGSPLTGLATVDGLGAFACFQHTGVPLYV